MKKVLIVDDDEAFLYQYKTLLADGGFKVETVMDAIEVFEKVETFHPDLIILDTYIKEYDGRTIGKMLKLSEHSKNIPVILCSADLSVGNNPYHNYANLFLSKPIKSNDLIKAVNTLTNLNP